MAAILALLLRVSLSLALYAFLAWALWSLWQDLQKTGQSAQATPIPQLQLILWADGGKKRFYSTSAALTIGRDPANNCSIPDATVSTFHAQLQYHHNQWWLQDLGSRNGTFLNQQPVEEAIVVTSGDQIRCGGISLELYVDRAE